MLAFESHRHGKGGPVIWKLQPGWFESLPVSMLQYKKPVLLDADYSRAGELTKRHF